MPEKSSTATKDLVALFAVAAVALALAVYFDAFENFERWARPYERWQIDELVMIPLVLAFAFGFYAWRRRGEIMKSEQRFRSLVQNASDVILIMGPDQTVRYISPAVEPVLGYKPEDVIGKDNLAPVHPDDLARVQAAVADALSNPGTPSYVELRLLHADGSWRHIESTCTSLLDDPAVGGIVFNSRDVTERKRAEDKLRASEAGLAEAQRIAHLGSWEYEPKKNGVYWSDETYRIFGFAPQQFVPTFQDFLHLIHPDDRMLVREDMAKVLRGERLDDIEFRIVRPGGEVRLVQGQRSVERAETDGSIKMVGVVQDITEHKALERRLEQQAFHDALTGLPNRALFAARLERALARADREGGKVAVLFVDLDDFKSVNDSLGHWAGDELLVEFARRLAGSMRPEDTVARFGGDEFAVLLEGAIEERSATEVAKRAIAELRREPFALIAHEVFVTPSIGIAVSGHTERGWEDLLRRADLALHRAKEEGKASYCCFTPDLDEFLRARLKLEGELREALERGEFRVFYQPKVSISSGEIVGMEALLRWEHPERGLLAPSGFLAVAEETGLIVPIGQWVLRAACRQAKEWQERHPKDPPLSISVNLSAKQFRRQDLAEDVGAVLSECGMDPRALTLEITESTAMEDAHATAEVLKKLKVRGVRIEVDDFGTGYSSLSYLKRFPVDYLKVDRSFVAGLGQNPEDEGIVRTVVELSHTLGLEAVAEGVETGEQLGLLQEMGCGIAQGLYFWGALSAEAAGELLAAYNA